MKHFIVLCSILLLTGCASVNGSARITEIENGVKFEASRPTEMTYKKDGAEYTYNSQAPSLISRIMSAVTLGVVGAGR